MKLRGALSQESRHALPLVCGSKGQRRQFLLKLQPSLQIRLGPTVDGLLGAADGDGGLGCDALHHGLRLLHQAVVGHHAVDQADALGLLRFHLTAGVDQLLGDPRTHQPGQALGAAEAGDQSQARLRLPKYSLFRRDPQITGHGQLATAAQCVAVHHRQHRLIQLLDAAEQRLGPAGVAPALPAAVVLHLGNVRPCGKSPPLARDDHTPDLTGLLQPADDPVQLGERLVIQRVERLGPAQRDDGNIALPLQSGVLQRRTELLKCHAYPSFL